MKISTDTENNYIHAKIENEDLSKDDVLGFEQAIDSYIQSSGQVPNLVIESEHLPHFPNFKIFQKHVKFAYEKSKHIKKVAVVTDSVVGDVLPDIANVFLKADIRHFKMNDAKLAMDWVSEREDVPAA